MESLLWLWQIKCGSDGYLVTVRERSWFWLIKVKTLIAGIVTGKPESPE